MGMRSEGARERLLRTGMGCFAFASGMTLVNALVLPIGRNALGYSVALCYTVFMLALAGYLLLGKMLAQTPLARLEVIRRIAVPVFLMVFFAAQVILGYLMEYTPSGDNFMIYRASEMLASDGTFDRNPDFKLYFARFSNQWGFLLFCTGIWKICGLLGIENAFMLLVVIQAALYIPAVLSVLAIARKSHGIRAELMMLSMLATCLPMYLAAGVLYTDTFSLPFVLMGLNLALDVIQEKDKKRQLLFAAACGAVITFGALIKMTVLIVLIAAVIVWVLTLRPLRAGIYAVICALMFMAGNTMVQHTLLEGPLDRQMYQQHNTPIIHWVLMSIPSSDNEWGVFSYDYAITWEMMEAGASREEVMDSIYSRMKDKIYTLRYPNRLVKAALYKNIAAFADGTFGMTEMLDDLPVRENRISSFVLEGRPNYPVYKGIACGIYYAQMLLAVLGCVQDIRRRKLDMSMAYIAGFGMMLFLMLWEARTRYFFGFIPVFLLLGSQYAAGRSEERWQ